MDDTNFTDQDIREINNFLSENPDPTFLSENNNEEATSVTNDSNRIEASISIDADILKKYVNDIVDNDKTDIIDAVRDIVVDELHDSILEDIDYNKIVRAVNDDISYSDIAEVVWDEYLDADDIADKVEEKIDYSALADFVVDRLDMSDIASNVQEYIDFDEGALILLNQYDPGNTCSLGHAFTGAIADAIKHLVNTNHHVIDLIRDWNPVVAEGDDNRLEDKTIEPEMVTNGTIVPEPQIVAEPDMYEVLKRVVNELISQYVSTFDSDPFMRIRMEAKAFDIYHEMKGVK
jgi:hypothetical protein